MSKITLPVPGEVKLLFHLRRSGLDRDKLRAVYYLRQGREAELQAPLLRLRNVQSIFDGDELW